MLDVISPCVTFNDHEGSTKSYAYVKDHDDPLEEVSFVPFFEDISGRLRAGLDPGSDDARRVEAVSEEARREGYDATDKIGALKRLHETARRGEFATGIIYIEPDRDDFLTQLNVVDEPLATLPLDRVRPGPGGARRDHGRPPLDEATDGRAHGRSDDGASAVPRQGTAIP